jgi:hypothetical protein
MVFMAKKEPRSSERAKPARVNASLSQVGMIGRAVAAFFAFSLFRVFAILFACRGHVPRESSW